MQVVAEAFVKANKGKNVLSARIMRYLWGAAGRDGLLGRPRHAQRSRPTLFVHSTRLYKFPITNVLPARLVCGSVCEEYEFRNMRGAKDSAIPSAT
jgi:hypothetical protein